MSKLVKWRFVFSPHVSDESLLIRDGVSGSVSPVTFQRERNLLTRNTGDSPNLLFSFLETDSSPFYQLNCEKQISDLKVETNSWRFMSKIKASGPVHDVLVLYTGDSCVTASSTSRFRGIMHLKIRTWHISSAGRKCQTAQGELLYIPWCLLEAQADIASRGNMSRSYL